MKVNDFHEFVWVPTEEIEAITKDAQMDCILSLDISLPMRIGRVENLYSLLYGLSLILPNLREIDPSNILSYIGILTIYSIHCPHLKRITWNNFDNDSLVLLSGHGMRPSNNIQRNHHE
jgi:hypothetical protein